MPAVDFKPGPDLMVGDTVDWFGEPHTIREFVTNAGPLVDAGILPLVRIAVDGDWRMTVPNSLVPCLTGAGVQ